MGSGEWGVGNGEWGVGNGEWGMGDKEKGGQGDKEKEISSPLVSPSPCLPDPLSRLPHSPLPTPHSRFFSFQK